VSQQDYRMAIAMYRTDPPFYSIITAAPGGLLEGER
jgi:hypothetical protein